MSLIFLRVIDLFSEPVSNGIVLDLIAFLIKHKIYKFVRCFKKAKTMPKRAVKPASRYLRIYLAYANYSTINQVET